MTAVSGKMRMCEPGNLPAACASCGGQYPDRRHVDFGAAWDGPVLNQLEIITEGATPQQIDDLKVCEDCVRNAMDVLKLDDAGQTTLDQLNNRISELSAMNHNQRGYIDQLQRTVAIKPDIPKRAKGA